MEHAGFRGTATRPRRQIGAEVKADDDYAAERQRQGHVACRIADFSGREGDVVPRIGGEERPDLRRAERDEKFRAWSAAELPCDGKFPAASRDRAKFACTTAAFHPISTPTPDHRQQAIRSSWK